MKHKYKQDTRLQAALANICFNGSTQEQIGAVSGLSVFTVSRIMRGYNKPSKRTERDLWMAVTNITAQQARREMEGE